MKHPATCTRAGVSLEAIDSGVNGAVVRGVAQGGAIAGDGRIRVNDLVTMMNGESLRGVTQIQTRLVMQRANLVSGDVAYVFLLKFIFINTFFLKLRHNFHRH